MLEPIAQTPVAFLALALQVEAISAHCSIYTERNLNLHILRTLTGKAWSWDQNFETVSCYRSGSDIEKTPVYAAPKFITDLNQSVDELNLRPETGGLVTLRQTPEHKWQAQVDISHWTHQAADHPAEPVVLGQVMADVHLAVLSALLRTRALAARVVGDPVAA